MYREIVDWPTSKISAQISSVMLLRASDARVRYVWMVLDR